MTAVDLLELDDTPDKWGSYLTAEQRRPFLEEVWAALTTEEREALRQRMRHFA